MVSSSRSSSSSSSSSSVFLNRFLRVLHSFVQSLSQQTHAKGFFSQRKCCNKSLQPQKLPEPAAQNVSLQDRRLLIEKVSDMLKQCGVIRGSFIMLFLGT